MKIAHVSDLHFGRHDQALADSLAADIRQQAPDLLIASGDFTQIGSKSEFVAARQFLDSLGLPFFAVPGNHDVPAVNMIRRFLQPYGLFRRHISSEIEPFLEMGGVAFAGLNTARRMRFELNWSHGSISRRQLETLERRFEKATPDAVRVVIAHHPLLQPEVKGEVAMRQVDRADVALETLSRLGVRLVMSGHFHLSYIRRHTHVVQAMEGAPLGAHSAAAAPLLVVQASSAISTRLRGEPNAYNIITFGPEPDRIDVEMREWHATGWRARQQDIPDKLPDPATSVSS